MREELIEPIPSVRCRRNVVDRVDSHLKEWIEDEGGGCNVWEDPPGAVHTPHDHPYSHRVLVQTGWIEFTVRGDTYRLEAGDSLDLPARVRHEAQTSPEEPTRYWLIQPPS